ncbi:MAG: hypothetical protein FOGNACKC_04883 [Anaerolineae bacterium]|nr:hypothetical protein [Anaerolineae bacterium]
MSGQLRIFILFTLAYFLSYFYRSANAVIAPDLASQMNLDAAQLGLMTSLFFAAFALAQIPVGIGLDRWGSRWVTPGLMLAGVAGSLLFAGATSFGVLALGRALIGLGMGGILMGSFKAFSQWFPGHRFATVSGLLVGIGSSGALVAATPLAWLNNAFGWRTAFAIGAVVTLLVALSIVIWTRNTPPDVPWLSSQQQGGRLSDVLTDGRFWRIVPLSFFMAGTLLSFQGLWAGPYLFDVLQLGKIEAGNFLLLLAIGATTGFTASGWLSDRFGLVRMIILSAILLFLCQIALIFQPPAVVVRLTYMAWGFSGAFNVMLLAHGRQIFPPQITGRAVSLVNLFGIGGSFVLQWALGFIIGGFPADAAGRYPPLAYSTAWSVTAAGLLLALLWYLPLARDSAQ